MWSRALRAIPRVQLSLGRASPNGWTFGHPGPDRPGWVWPEDADFQQTLDRANYSSLVAICIGYRADNAASTPWVLERVDGTETVVDHEVLRLLNNPMENEDGRSLCISVWKSLDVRGNAYLLKVANGTGRPSELVYRPAKTMQPVTDRDGWLTGYKYRPGGMAGVKDFDKADVIHLRYPNPDGSPWEGLSPLASVGLELYIDRESGRYTAAVLKNGARPGFMASLEAMPEEDRPNKEELDAVRDYFDRQYSGENRGKSSFVEFPIRVHQMAYTPDQMHLPENHNFAEERIAGVYKLPAAILQFRAGLQRTTANASIMTWRKMAWEESIIPTQDLVAAQMSRQLLPDFMGSDARNWRLAYDRSHVPVLQGDLNMEVERLTKAAGGPIMSVAEAREQLPGVEVEDEHNFWWVPQSLTATGADGLMLDAPEPEEPPMPFPPEDDDTTEPVRALPRMSRQARKLTAQLNRDEATLRDQFASTLGKAFRQLGREAATAFEQQDTATRQLDADDEALLSRTMGTLAVNVWQQEALVPAFDGHYVRSLRLTVGSINGALGLNVNLPDPVQRQIIAEGGTRLGLMDLQGETRDAVFRALHDGRALGEGQDALARRIRADVGAGHFTKAGPNYRARLIARTETKHAQNRSSAATYREAGITQVTLVDDQLGYGDEECSQRNGERVSLEEGERLLTEEHPQGTLRLLPLMVR